jgi:hypothetical protein
MTLFILHPHISPHVKKRKQNHLQQWDDTLKYSRADSSFPGCCITRKIYSVILVTLRDWVFFELLFQYVGKIGKERMNKKRSKNKVHVKKDKEKNKQNRVSVLQYVRIRCLLSFLLLTKGSLVSKHVTFTNWFCLLYCSPSETLYLDDF